VLAFCRASPCAISSAVVAVSGLKGLAAAAAEAEEFVREWLAIALAFAPAASAAVAAMAQELIAEELVKFQWKTIINCLVKSYLLERQPLSLQPRVIAVD